MLWMSHGFRIPIKSPRSSFAALTRFAHTLGPFSASWASIHVTKLACLLRRLARRRNNYGSTLRLLCGPARFIGLTRLPSFGVASLCLCRFSKGGRPYIGFYEDSSSCRYPQPRKPSLVRRARS